MIRSCRESLSPANVLDIRQWPQKAAAEATRMWWHFTDQADRTLHRYDKGTYDRRNIEDRWSEQVRRAGTGSFNTLNLRRNDKNGAAGFKGCPVFSLVTQEKISMNFLLHNRHEILNDIRMCEDTECCKWTCGMSERVKRHLTADMKKLRFWHTGVFSHKY